MPTPHLCARTAELWACVPLSNIELCTFRAHLDSLWDKFHLRPNISGKSVTQNFLFGDPVTSSPLAKSWRSSKSSLDCCHLCTDPSNSHLRWFAALGICLHSLDQWLANSISQQSHKLINHHFANHWSRQYDETRKLFHPNHPSRSGYNFCLGATKRHSPPHRRTDWGESWHQVSSQPPRSDTRAACPPSPDKEYRRTGYLTRTTFPGSCT